MQTLALKDTAGETEQSSPGLISKVAGNQNVLFSQAEEGKVALNPGWTASAAREAHPVERAPGLD